MIKKRILGIFIIIFTLCIPLIVISLQDYYAFNQVISIADNQTQEVLKSHPVISRIYQQVYEYNKDKEESNYVIRQKDEYTEEQQTQLELIQSLYTREIQKLVNKDIIDKEMLEISDQNEVQIDFGSIVDSQNIYGLNQVYRMLSEDDKSMHYLMDSKTNKIIDIKLTQQKKFTITKQELKARAWLMIEYLELDDIEDWVYNQDGYESNIAKIRVSCSFEKYLDYYNYSVNVSVLGLFSPSSLIENVNEGIYE